MKRIAIVLSIMLLAISCRSTDGTKYTEGEIRNALMSLSSDMFSEVDTASPVEEERIIEALPATYSAYAEYVPLYGSIASDYAEKISRIISPLLPQPMHVVLETASAFLIASTALRDDEPVDMRSSIRSTCFPPYEPLCPSPSI